MLLVSVITSGSIDTLHTDKAYAAGINLAFKKEAFASGMYNDTGNYAPEKINDGDYGTLWSDGNVTFTGMVAGYYYIAVDLADAYIVNQIIAYPRIDFDDSAMLHNWYIQLSNTRDFSDAVTVAHIESKCEYGGKFVFDVELDGSYRYVRIATPKPYSTCGELEVFGEKYDPEIMGGEHNFIDAQNQSYNAAAMVCDELGIIKATGKASFEGEKMMTRAAATEAIVKMMNYALEDNDASIYEDVSEEHYAKDYIMTAYKKNLIAKSDKFRPDEYITQGEFCKIILYAFGYRDIVERRGDWTLGVSDVSRSLKLLSYVSGDFNDRINRGTAAQIIYNALKAPLNNLILIDGGGTPEFKPTDEASLYTLYRMKIVEGIMTENSASTLTHPTSKKENHIKIGNKVYDDETGLMQRMLGKEVGVLVNDDGDIITGFENTQRNKITKVYDSYFVSASNGVYTYLENDKDRTKRVKFDEQEVYVLKNYAAFPDWTYADLEPADGYIEFIDNDKDGTIEVISVLQPEVVIGGYILPLNGDVNVVDKDGSKTSIVNPAWTRFMRNGDVTTPGKYSENDVILVYKSSNDAILFVEGYSNTVIGNVESVDSEYAIISGVEYNLSEYYREMAINDGLRKRNSLLKLGEEQTVILDGQNNIICAVAGNVDLKSDIIGFVAKVNNNEFDETCGVRVFTNYGEFKTYEFARNTTIDDRRIKKTNLMSEIKYGTVNLKDKLIKFRLNSSEEIYKVEILVDSGIVLGTNVVYINNGYGIYNKGWLVQPLKPDTLCFTIPKSGSNYLSAGYEQYYIADTVSDHMSELDQIEDKWTFYDVDDLGYPSVAVRYRGVASYGEGLRVVSSSGNVNGLIVRSVSKYYDENENEEGYLIKGLDMSGNQKTIYLDYNITTIFKADDLQGDKFADTDADPFNDDKDIIIENLSTQDVASYTMPVSSLKAGDLIRYETDGDAVIALERTFEADSGKDGVYQRPIDGTYYSAGEMYPQYPDAEYRLVYGKTSKIVDDTFIMTTCEREAGKGAMTQYVDYTSIQKVIICSGKDFEVYDGGALPAYFKPNQEALLYTTDRAKPVCLILYE